MLLFFFTPIFVLLACPSNTQSSATVTGTITALANLCHSYILDVIRVPKWILATDAEGVTMRSENALGLIINSL